MVKLPEIFGILWLGLSLFTTPILASSPTPPCDEALQDDSSAPTPQAVPKPATGDAAFDQLNQHLTQLAELFPHMSLLLSSQEIHEFQLNLQEFHRTEASVRDINQFIQQSKEMRKVLRAQAETFIERLSPESLQTKPWQRRVRIHILKEPQILGLTLQTIESLTLYTHFQLEGESQRIPLLASTALHWTTSTIHELHSVLRSLRSLDPSLQEQMSYAQASERLYDLQYSLIQVLTRLTSNRPVFTERKQQDDFTKQAEPIIALLQLDQLLISPLNESILADLQIKNLDRDQIPLELLNDSSNVIDQHLGSAKKESIIHLLALTLQARIRLPHYNFYEIEPWILGWEYRLIHRIRLCLTLPEVSGESSPSSPSACTPATQRALNQLVPQVFVGYSTALLASRTSLMSAILQDYREIMVYLIQQKSPRQLAELLSPLCRGNPLFKDTVVKLGGSCG